MPDKEPILKDSDFEIDFQDFGSLVIPESATTIPTIPTSSLSNQYEGLDGQETKLTMDSGNLLLDPDPPGPGGPADDTPTTNSAFWSFEFYRQYFDVNDEMVLERLKFACIPTPTANYLEKLRPLPDLYGPLWVCITLIFSTAISGNLADFFQTLGKDTEWAYDFKKVTIAATVVFSYVTVVPGALSGFLWWRKSQAQINLADVLSLYGYCLTVFIPVSLLLCINYEWVRWILVLGMFATSGTVLLSTVWRVLSEEPRQMAMVVSAVLAILHLALILLFKMYFFKSSGASVIPT